ncbi:hypothetical protein [Bacteroides fragilis]|uniref:hypothetical protein n=1 Tax=Bacteroides fragilis TaxID=817 RepID=UPI000515D99C|nr:hypothetical protein [Bacteroides fragilis]
MKIFTIKEFELKEDEIFELAKEEGGVILKSDDCRYFKLVPLKDEFQTIEIELPVYAWEILESRAQENGVTLEQFVIKTLEDYVNKQQNK